MIWDWVFLLIGLVLLTGGAEGLVRGAVSLSIRLGVSPLVIGLTVLAFSTSSPELFVAIQAAWSGNGDIALGNVVGSNILNIALILGIAACVYPMVVQKQVIRTDIPVMFAATGLFVLFFLDKMINRWEGVVLLVALFVYIGFSVYKARQEENSDMDLEAEGFKGPNPQGLWFDLVLVGVGLGILTLGANLMVKGASNIAEAFGVPQVIIGLTIVAIGTSLPELATCLMAAIKKEGDLVVGNLLGSNIFNLAAILGAAALVTPLGSDAVSWLDIGVMIAITLVTLPIMRSGFVVSRGEGIFLVLTYVGYVIYLIVSLEL